MKHNASRSETRSLAEELAALRGLDATALKERWRALYRTEAPVRIGRTLLQQAVAYRLQERALGGLKSSTLRLLERVVENHDSLRPRGIVRESSRMNRSPRDWRANFRKANREFVPGWWRGMNSNRQF